MYISFVEIPSAVKSHPCFCNCMFTFSSDLVWSVMSCVCVFFSRVSGRLCSSAVRDCLTLTHPSEATLQKHKPLSAEGKQKAFEKETFEKTLKSDETTNQSIAFHLKVIFADLHGNILSQIDLNTWARHH